MANLHADLVRFAFVGVDRAVASANRIEYGRAGNRNRPTDSREIGNVALPRRQLAELPFIAGQARNPPTAPLAFPPMSDRDAMSGGFAGVSVGNAVAPTDRLPDVRTTRGHKRASATNTCGLAYSGRQLAELGIGAGRSRWIRGIAGHATFAEVCNVDAGLGGFAFAAISVSIATANRTARRNDGRLQRTDVRTWHAYAEGIRVLAGSRRQATEFVFHTLRNRGQAPRIALPPARSGMCYGNSGGRRIASIGIGHSVATANGLPNVRTTGRNRSADAYGGGIIARTRRKLAELPFHTR